MHKPLYPSLYQINTRVWLTQLARELGRPATLDDIPDTSLDHLAEKGFDWIWFLSVWQTATTTPFTAILPGTAATTVATTTATAITTTGITTAITTTRTTGATTRTTTTTSTET